MTSLAAIDLVRQEARLGLDPARKAALGQFMTPGKVAKFMASLFSEGHGAVRLLDPGAGVGSLTAAFVDRWGSAEISAVAYEIDGGLAEFLGESLASLGRSKFKPEIIRRDFIEDAVEAIQFRRGQPFTHAILNPPYKKIGSESHHRSLLRQVGVETVNLYAGFLALTVALMGEGGEVVAIVPRSFCNGLYYRPFRVWLLERIAVRQIHLFHSRTSAFHEDDVLQENVILKLVRGGQQGRLTVSTSSDTSFSDVVEHEYSFDDIVHPGDNEKFIHVPLSPEHGGIHTVPLATCSLKETGLEVSTGPVVDFRLKAFLRKDAESGTVPLLYATHFAEGRLDWPKESKKPNALVRDKETEKWLYPNGYYTVVRRFSSKEEKRRVVACVVEPEKLGSEVIGFENHLNVFHTRKNGISADVAHGLAAFLNSTAVDECFRRFSGHTQVNATDLRMLRYPETKVLEKLGRWARKTGVVSQDGIDKKVAELSSGR